VRTLAWRYRACDSGLTCQPLSQGLIEGLRSPIAASSSENVRDRDETDSCSALTMKHDGVLTGMKPLTRYYKLSPPSENATCF
jgi:hypothetical protein